MEDMIEINRHLEIPESELSFSSSRSGGPGGQNVNKVSTRVALRFDLANSPSLTEEQRERLLHRLSSRISKEGILQVVSQRHRSQSANKLDAVARFQQLLRAALAPRRRRVPTKVPKSAQRRRLQQKKRRAQLKKLRSGPTEE